MTPQEKAKELTDKFFPNYSFDSWDIRTGYAKKHALMCVEEIMKEVEFINEGVQSVNWLEVRTEIEKL